MTDRTGLMQQEWWCRWYRAELQGICRVTSLPPEYQHNGTFYRPDTIPLSQPCQGSEGSYCQYVNRSL